MLAQSVPVYVHFLNGFSAVLTKAEAHCEAHKIAPEAILQARLFPDMFPMIRQVQLACDFATRCCDRLAGREPKSFPDTETGFADLRARLAAAAEYLTSFTAQDFDGAATREIVLKLRAGEMRMTGAQFLETYSKPQFFFHLTTAYDLLRHNGVPLGKRDFMGAA